MSPWELSEEDSESIYDALHSAASALADQHGTPAPDVSDAPPRQRADRHLSMLTALTAIQAHVEDAIHGAASAAGATGAITYADLGTAAGITRQSARTRWPGVIPDARPGRPRAALTLEDVGPHCEHGRDCSQDGACSQTGYVESWCRTTGCPLCGEMLEIPYGARAILIGTARTLDDVRIQPLLSDAEILGGSDRGLDVAERAEITAYWERYPLVRRAGDPRVIDTDRRQEGRARARSLFGMNS
ncbi:hypothetical protein ABZ815_52140 [Nonomuraea sp. NPDC047529]|uniref:hypothetical protein n=1 Tax=Nonomuraea sp. NPDC047529 TaxID=3155623 RepID=UPI0033E5CD8C